MSQSALSQNERAILTDAQIFDLARPLVSILEKFYQDSKNEEGFQKWLKAKNQ